MLVGAARRWLLLAPCFIFIFAAWNYHVQTRDWINYKLSRSYQQNPIQPTAGQDEVLPPPDAPALTNPDLDDSRSKYPESSSAGPSELVPPVEQAYEPEPKPHRTQPADSNQEKSHPDQPTQGQQDQEKSSQGGQDQKEPFHDVLYGISRPDKTYFNITMGQQITFNPNILPHPTEPETFLVIAQQDGRTVVDGRYYSELFCIAKFMPTGHLECIRDLATLFTTLSHTTHCLGGLAILTANMGPHDGRVFYGPRGRPYIIYGSQSSYTCMSLWIQNLQVLMGSMVTWGFVNHRFENATEVMRPEPWAPLEKNWLVFWYHDEMYVHYDLYPKRTFAKLGIDGSSGPDLAPESYKHDEHCLKKLPSVGPEESFHQATNSLSITLCNRSNPTCTPNDDNTFIFILAQHKQEPLPFAAIYEPYLVAFRSRPPFELYAISKKPFWYNGRTGDKEYVRSGATEKQQLFYTTSMNWKKAGQNYHGFQDDVLLIGFGIENDFSAGIDVVAGDLFKSLDLCSSGS